MDGRGFVGSGDPTDSGENGVLGMREGAGSVEGSIVVEAIGALFATFASLPVVCSFFAEVVNLSVDWRQQFFEFVLESAERCNTPMVVC